MVDPVAAVRTRDVSHLEGDVGRLVVAPVEHQVGEQVGKSPANGGEGLADSLGVAGTRGAKSRGNRRAPPRENEQTGDASEGDGALADTAGTGAAIGGRRGGVAVIISLAAGGDGDGGALPNADAHAGTSKASPKSSVRDTPRSVSYGRGGRETLELPRPLGASGLLEHQVDRVADLCALPAEGTRELPLSRQRLDARCDVGEV